MQLSACRDGDLISKTRRASRDSFNLCAGTKTKTLETSPETHRLPDDVQNTDQSVLEVIRGSNVVHTIQSQDRPVLDLEVVQDIKHEPSVPLLSHHKAVKDTEPSRPTLIMDLCTEQKHIYESYLALVFRLLHLADDGFI